MNENEKGFLKYLESVLNEKGAEIFNIKSKDVLLKFIYKNTMIYINVEGKIIFEDYDNNNQIKDELKEFVLEAQNKFKFDKELPIANFKKENLDKLTILSNNYYKLLQIKNIVLGYRQKGIFGFEYIVATKSKNNYLEINVFNNYIKAEIAISKRALLIYQNQELLDKEELKILVYIIDKIINNENNDFKEKLIIIEEKFLKKIISLDGE